MRIAILGTRGVPACYSGFETLAEKIGSRLIKRGHQVTVYCRSHYAVANLKKYQGMRLVVLPALRFKYFETISHTFLSTLHALLKNYDIILYCNAANAIFTILPRLFGKKVILHVDGLDHRRKKWSWCGKCWYLFNQWLAKYFPHRVITDAQNVQLYYRSHYQLLTQFIPNGSDLKPCEKADQLKEFGLEPARYFLYVGRLVPENNALAVIKAYKLARLIFPLVIVGNSPYSKKYHQQLKQAADGANIIFTGAIFGEGYRQLQTHAFVYIQASEVGGIHPALVEAMSVGNCVIVNDVPENRETAGEAAIYFKAANPMSLVYALRQVANQPELVAKFRELARLQAGNFNWDKITAQYEQIFIDLKK